MGSEEAGGGPERQLIQLDLSALTEDRQLQFRGGIDRELVSKYTKAMQANADATDGGFPPLEATRVGDRYLLTDGFHRKEAMWAASRYRAWVIVTRGTFHDAWRAALRANKASGKVVGSKDARGYVLGALRLLDDMSDDEFTAQYGADALGEGGRKRGDRAGWSDRDVARLTNLSQTTVSRIVAELRNDTDNHLSVWCRRAKSSEKQSDTSLERSGKKKRAEQSSPPLPAPVTEHAESEAETTPEPDTEQTAAPAIEDAPTPAAKATPMPAPKPIDASAAAVAAAERKKQEADALTQRVSDAVNLSRNAVKALQEIAGLPLKAKDRKRAQTATQTLMEQLGDTYASFIDTNAKG